MNTIEYSLELRTGENLEFCEIDPSVNQSMFSPEVCEASSGILELCTHVSRRVIEKAKKGDTKPLEGMLRIPPVGCLLRIPIPECGEMKTCVLSDRKECTTKNVDRKKNLGLFPYCWSFKTVDDEPDGPHTAFTTKYLTNTIVDAWRRGKYVLIIDS